MSSHLRNVLKAVPDAILEIDRAGHILLVNAAAEQMFGYNRQEFLTLNVDTLVPPAYRNTHAQHRVDYAHQPKSRPMGIGFELEAQRRDGFLFPVEISLSPIHTEDASTVIVSVRDITDRKQVEKALQESEVKFRTLAQLVPQFVWMCTPDGLNVYFNQRWVDYTGLTLEESYGKGWNIPFHPDDQQTAWDAWNHAVATGEPYRVESRLRAADGSYRWFLMLGLPLQDSSGNAASWFGTCTDIEELRQAAAERERLIGELQEALARVKLLTGLLPICAGCKKIRDEHGTWRQVEIYIRDHSEANFSHGMCPDCLEKFGWTEQ